MTNAMKTHCPRGHEYSLENTKTEKCWNGSMTRKCKTCISARLKRKYIERTRAFKVEDPSKEYLPNNVKHGDFGTRLYRIWGNMLSRCSDTNNQLYGGRGIKVCDEWKDYIEFSKWAKSNGYDKLLTLDRVDSDGNYEPSNCRWVTAKVQANNTRRNHKIMFNDTVRTLQQWSESMGIQASTIRYRLKSGWTVADALTRRVQ